MEQMKEIEIKKYMSVLNDVKSKRYSDKTDFFEKLISLRMRIWRFPCKTAKHKSLCLFQTHRHTGFFCGFVEISASSC